MKKMRLLKVILAALMAASGFSSCVKDVTGDVPYHEDGSSDDFVKVDGIDGSVTEEFVLQGDVPYTEENIEIGEIPDDDDSFVKLDPVSGEEAEEEYILDGDIAYTEDAACQDDSFVLEDEVSDDEEENLIRGLIPKNEVED